MPESRTEVIGEDQIAADNTNTNLIRILGHGFLDGGVKIKAILAEQTNNSDAEWNIEVNGNAIFGTEQQVSASDTVETFVPGQNKYAADETWKIEINKSTGAGNAADVLNLVVVLEVYEE